MTMFGKQFLSLVLALVVSSFHTSDATSAAGLVGDLLPVLQGVTNSTQGESGGIFDPSTYTDLFCGEDAAPAVQLLCGFLTTFVSNQLDEALSNGDGSTRKLIRGGN
jgi:hypothetical protein